ncbi:MAG: serine hydrolase domain-containing protein [Pseudomonadales bacterium]|jgi:CubicO group peptidase (beta-lactamase class C family)
MIKVPRIFALSVAALLLMLAGNGLARELTPVRPERVGLDADRLDRIAENMNAAVADGTMVGGVGMIARYGRLAYVESWGERDREAGDPMTQDDIFRIYSMSKPITGVALMILYEEGKFFLNDPVAKYIPELANLKVALSTADGGQTRIVSDGTRSRTIGEGDGDLTGQTRAPRRQPTVHDLMTHTAGFTYGVFGNTEVDKLYREHGILFEQPNLKAFVQELGQIPLQYEPGTRWHYSVAVDVQGRLVEVLSGMRFGEFLEKRLFGPLGMTDTGFVVPKDKLPRLAQLYSPEGTAAEAGEAFLKPSTSKHLVVADARLSDNFMEGATFQSGGGGLVSTARDYLRFCQMMLNGGELDGVRILSPKTVELMTTNNLGEISMGFGQQGVGFGLDFAVVEDVGEVGEVGSVGEYNWGGAAGTRFWVDPQEGLIGVFMVQSIPHRTRLADEFKVLSYQAVVE